MMHCFLAPAAFVLCIIGLLPTLADAGDNCTSNELVLEVDILPLLPPEAIGGSALDAAVIAPDDIWAVGPMGLGGIPAESCTVALHYDGRSWTFFPSPCPAGPEGQDVDVESVDAVSSNEVYAAGKWRSGYNVASTFVMRWDGEQWEQLPAPGLSDPGEGEQGHFFTSVEAIDSQNIWFGGQTEYGPGNAFPYMVHYDGSTFTQYLLPKNPLGINAAHRVRAISAVAPHNVWVAGSGGGNAVAEGRIYVARWDGATWQHVPTPHPGWETPTGAGGEVMHNIIAFASGDVWLVGGSYQYDPPPVGGTLASAPIWMHYNGSEWKSFDVPAFAWDNAIAAFAPDDIYVVGYTGSPDFDEVLLHWNGAAWSIVLEHDLPGNNSFSGLATVGPCELLVLDYSRIHRYRPAAAPLTGDCNGDGVVNVTDLLAVIVAWGRCPAPPRACPADIAPPPSGDGVVDVNDLLLVIGNWS